MSAASSGGNGQAPTQPASPAANGQAPTQPASPAANGQAPTPAPANNDPAPSGAPHGQAPTAIPTPQLQLGLATVTESEWKRITQELEESRRDAAKYRDEIRRRDEANMTAAQKLERDFADSQAKNFEYEARLQRQSLELTGMRLASTLGIADPTLALAAVLSEHATEIKYTADGAPENLDALLKAVLKDHPSLGNAAGAASGQLTRQPMGSGGATNPGAGARAGGPFTREQIARMSPREYEQNRAAIMESLKQGAIRPNT